LELIIPLNFIRLENKENTDQIYRMFQWG